MKVFELTSGFIAAVLIALGAYQYVNKTTVEEKPAVKEHATEFAQERWFLVDVSNASNPANPTLNEQMITAVLNPNGTPSAPCAEPSGIICAVKLALATGVEPNDLINQSVGTAVGNPGIDFSPELDDPYSYREPEEDGL